jgi:uncharacterized OB-fold protein
VPKPVLPFRVLPEVGPENEFFWTAGRDGRLRVLRCGACGYFVHPPVPRCPRCLEAGLAPEALSGRGTLYSFTVNHKPWIPDAAPYVIGLVELVEQEGLRLTTNVVDCPPEELRIGMPLEVVFEEQGDVWLPLFRPAAA